MAPCCGSIRRWPISSTRAANSGAKRATGRRRWPDFAAAIKLNPDHAAAKANYKSLALELERLGALMAVNNRPSFDCASARRAVEKAICANPDLANLDRQINAANARAVRDAGRDNPRAGRALQREQDDFIARRNAAFGRPDYDLQKAMRNGWTICWRSGAASPVADGRFRLDLPPLRVTMPVTNNATAAPP